MLIGIEHWYIPQLSPIYGSPGESDDGHHGGFCIGVAATADSSRNNRKKSGCGEKPGKHNKQQIGYLENVGETIHGVIASIPWYPRRSSRISDGATGYFALVITLW